MLWTTHHPPMKLHVVVVQLVGDSISLLTAHRATVNVVTAKINGMMAFFPLYFSEILL